MNKLMITGTIFALVLATGTIAYGTNSKQQTSTIEKKEIAVSITASNLEYVSTKNKRANKTVYNQQRTAKSKNITKYTMKDKNNHTSHNAEDDKDHNEHISSEHSSNTAGNGHSKNISNKDHNTNGHR